MGQIIKCKKCEDIIESKSRHNFVECKCGSIFIDGGNDYMRIGFPSGENEENWIEYIGKYKYRLFD